ncbi:MAG: 5-deoxy-glucuronate isomerase [Nocardioidaceae bacterium]|nr:5-deoxy-glucuronate isomerase [Nocardioidaceae bacterium]
MPDLHLPAGTSADDTYALHITPARAGWTYSGLSVLELDPGGSCQLYTEDAETLVLPLAGACEVTYEGQTLQLKGRESVFASVTDFAYLPRDAHVDVRSEHGGRFALPSACCERTLPFRYGPASGVPVELRGAGQASRQVNNFCTPDAFEADRLIACEVLTPAGNWSSYPPHKHDEDRDGESVLEEIYYYEIAEPKAFGDLNQPARSALPAEGHSGGAAPRGMAYQRVYGHEHSDTDVLAEVRTGDVVLIPHGWHGPSMAVPGYDLYYLNVMAGPGDERAWRICDDPVHGWVRETWHDQTIDPRLPFGGGS